MANQQVLDYIKLQIQRGVGIEEIKNTLIASGWEIADIEEAFSIVSSLNPPSSPQEESLILNSEPSQTIIDQPLKKPKKKAILIAIAIIGLVLIGGIAFGYFYFIQSPERMAKIMIKRLSTIKSLDYSGEIKTEISMQINSQNLLMNPLGGQGGLSGLEQELPQKQEFSFLVNFNGTADAQDLNNPKASFALTTKTLPQEKPSFGMEFRILNKITYIKLTEVPGSEFLDVSFLKNQWIKIDLKEMEKLGLKTETPKELEKTLTREQEDKIVNIIKQAKLFKTSQRLADEKIEGANTFHYKFTIDNEELKRVILEIDKITLEMSLTEQEIKDFNKGFESIGPIEGEIWLGKTDLLPHKFLFSLTIKETEIGNLGGEESTGASLGKFSGKFTATVFLKNFNKPAQVEIPSEVKNIEEIVNQLFGGFFEKNTKMTKDLGITTDIYQIRSLAEALYDNDYDALYVGKLSSDCVYSGGQKDVDMLAKDICEMGGDLKINRSSKLHAEDYCVYSKLNTSFGNSTDYFCLDSTFKMGYTTTDPKKASACPADTLYKR